MFFAAEHHAQISLDDVLADDDLGITGVLVEQAERARRDLHICQGAGAVNDHAVVLQYAHQCFGLFYHAFGAHGHRLPQGHALQSLQHRLKPVIPAPIGGPSGNTQRELSPTKTSLSLPHSLKTPRGRACVGISVLHRLQAITIMPIGKWLVSLQRGRSLGFLRSPAATGHRLTFDINGHSPDGADPRPILAPIGSLGKLDPS